MNKINLSINQEEYNIVLQGLGELPAKISHYLIMGLENQRMEQLQKENNLNEKDLE